MRRLLVILFLGAASSACAVEPSDQVETTSSALLTTTCTAETSVGTTISGTMSSDGLACCSGGVCYQECTSKSCPMYLDPTDVGTFGDHRKHWMFIFRVHKAR